MTIVTVLGGAGDMGRFVVQTLASDPAFSHVVIADMDIQAAQELATSIGGAVSTREVDAGDDASLGEVFGDCDAVVSCVGPFYRFGVPVLRAAIRNRVDYLDICDDWEPTLEMLDLNSEAEAAGIVALIGMGASPGVSNLLAVSAAATLDRVDKIVTAWSVGGGAQQALAKTGGSKPSAAVVHWLHQLTGTIRIVTEGQLSDVVPLQVQPVNAVGIGEGRGWTVGHPEALTLPRRWPGIRECVNVMVGSPITIAKVGSLAKLVDAGSIDVYEAAQRFAAADFPDFEVDTSPLDSVRLPPLFATVEGVRDGKHARRTGIVLALPPGGMGGATGIPAAVGLRSLLGDRPKPGVYTAEQVIDPVRFFDALGPHCEPALTGEGMILVAEEAMDSVEGTD